MKPEQTTTQTFGQGRQSNQARNLTPPPYGNCPDQPDHSSTHRAALQDMQNKGLNMGAALTRKFNKNR